MAPMPSASPCSRARRMGGDQRYQDERLARRPELRQQALELRALRPYEARRPAKCSRPHAADRDGFLSKTAGSSPGLNSSSSMSTGSCATTSSAKPARRLRVPLERVLRLVHRDGQGAAQRPATNARFGVLAHVLDRGLRLLHPFMPFVTEELWQALRAHIDDEMAPQLIIAWFPKSGANWKNASDDQRWTTSSKSTAHPQHPRGKEARSRRRPKVYLRADGLASALRETEAATAFTSRVEPEITGPRRSSPRANLPSAGSATPKSPWPCRRSTPPSNAPASKRNSLNLPRMLTPRKAAFERDVPLEGAATRHRRHGDHARGNPQQVEGLNARLAAL